MRDYLAENGVASALPIWAESVYYKESVSLVRKLCLSMRMKKEMTKMEFLIDLFLDSRVLYVRFAVSS